MVHSRCDTEYTVMTEAGCPTLRDLGLPRGPSCGPAQPPFLTPMVAVPGLIRVTAPCHPNEGMCHSATVLLVSSNPIVEGTPWLGWHFTLSCAHLLPYMLPHCTASWERSSHTWPAPCFTLPWTWRSPSKQRPAVTSVLRQAFIGFISF